MAPKVSVLLPVYNSERYLRAAMDSLLAQTFHDFELLVLCDPCADSSIEIVKSYADQRIRLVENPQKLGLAKSLNKGLLLACGEYVARHDSDDISLPERLALQIRFLDTNPAVVLAGAWGKKIGRSGEPLGSVRPVATAEDLRWQLLFGNCIIHTSVMFRKKEVLDEGGYRADLLQAEDYDLWCRLSRKYPIAQLPAELVCLRAHNASVSEVNARAVTDCTLDITKANLEYLVGHPVDQSLVRILFYCDGGAGSNAVLIGQTAVLLEEAFANLKKRGYALTPWIKTDYARRLYYLVSAYCELTRRDGLSMALKLVNPTRGICELRGMAVCLVKLAFGPGVLRWLRAMREPCRK